MQRLQLVFPSMENKKEVLEYLEEHFRNGEMHISGGGSIESYDEYEKWLEKIQKDTNLIQEDPSRVTSTQYLAISKQDKGLVGMIQIRHELNEYLLNYGGHIGYSVRPSQRRKGYAKEMLKLALEKCKQLKINKVLVTCNKNNIGSAKTIKANGGILEDERKIKNGEITQRYWISI